MIALATSALMAAVWQGILLAAVVWLGLRPLPKTPAAVRFAIWFAVFLVVTALPLITLWPHAPSAQNLAGHGAWLTLDPRWSLAIAAVWLTASALRAGTLAMAAHRTRALWKRATPIDLEAVAEPAIGARQARLCTSRRGRPALSHRLLFAQDSDPRMAAGKIDPRGVGAHCPPRNRPPGPRG